MKHSRRARRGRTQKKQLVPMLLGIALLVVTLLSIFLIFLKQPSKRQSDSKASTVETTASSSVMTSESSEVKQKSFGNSKLNLSNFQSSCIMPFT